VDDPSACSGAKAHQPKGVVQQQAQTAAPAPPASAGAPRGAASAASLDAAFLSETDVAGRWEIVNEAPEDPSQDPDLVRWGVVAKRARHYTRDEQGVVRVCSVELWGFSGEGHARLGKSRISYPDWHFERHGSVILMLRGLSKPRGGKGMRGVFPDCRRLGEYIAARLEAGSR